MIDFELNVDLLGNIRFAFSPLAEVGSQPPVAGEPRPAHLHAPWLRQVRDRLADVDIDLLLGVSPAGEWGSGFLYPRAIRPRSEPGDQLNAMPSWTRRSPPRSWPRWARSRVPRAARDLVTRPVPAARPARQRHLAVLARRHRAVLVPDVSVFSRTTCRYQAALSLSGVAFRPAHDLHPEVTLIEHR